MRAIANLRTSTAPADVRTLAAAIGGCTVARGQDVEQALTILQDAADAILNPVRRLSSAFANINSEPDAIQVDASRLTGNLFIQKFLLKPGPLQVISAVGNVIVPSAGFIRVSNTTAGSLTLTSAPTIPDGIDGQVILIRSVGTQNVVIQDQGTLASSGLRLSANTQTLAPRDCIWLQYDGVIGDWCEIGLTNVL